MSPSNWVCVRVRNSCEVHEGGKDELGRLVSGGFGDNSDGEREYSKGMKSDRNVVEVREDSDAKGVDEAVRDDKPKVNRYRLAYGRKKIREVGFSELEFKGSWP